MFSDSLWCAPPPVPNNNGGVSGRYGVRTAEIEEGGDMQGEDREYEGKE